MTCGIVYGKRLTTEQWQDFKDYIHEVEARENNNVACEAEWHLMISTLPVFKKQFATHVRKKPKVSKLKETRI